MVKETLYESPSVDVLEVIMEGVLCGSNESLGEVEGEW